MSAPERIWATVNGASTRLPDGGRQLIGGWSEDKDLPRAVEYIRADLSAIEAPAAEGEAVAGSDNAAIEIADAVISWMVKHDLLDADLEYHDDDIIAVLDDLALPAAASEVTDDMVQKAWEAYDAKSGYSKPERFRAALTSALKGDRP
jgi:hypothetical protein